MTDIIRKLCECYGPSGSEGAVRDIIRREVEASGVLKRKGCRVDVDPLGNLVGAAARARAAASA